MSGRLPDKVGRAYAARASEYVERLGGLEMMSAVDIETITRWGRQRQGAVLDAGSGPGHWTAHLDGLGCDVTGLDVVPAFLDSARARFPEVRFRLGDLDRLPYASESLNGVLAWYSLIHTPPESLPTVVRELARSLEPEGSLLVGWFLGERVEAFDHAVVTAYTWPVDEMTRLLDDAGLEVVAVQTRHDAGARPHADAVATRRAGHVAR